MVEKAAQAIPEQVIPTISKTLGLWEAGDQPLLEQLQAALQDRHMLLFLDNFEQVITAWLFWLRRGYPGEGTTFLERCTAAATSLRAQALFAAVVLAWGLSPGSATGCGI